jgi:hypothetical protein
VSRERYGIELELAWAMTNSAPTTANPQSPQRLLAWTFRRGTQFLTCELLCTSDSQYAVIATPHWSGGSVGVEQLSSGVNAFHRHAALAMQLRQQGWTVVAYAPMPSPRTPAPQTYPLAA